MASFDSINYSLRPSKCVQRGIIFEGLKALSDAIGLQNAVYIGLGSIWFTDFVIAHKVLGIDDVISIEKNEIGFRRAKFNKVYRSIDVRYGKSIDKLPEILIEETYEDRPWIVWLDYDGALEEEKIIEMRWLLLHAPENSIVLFTFSTTLNAYGKPKDRPERLKELLGSVVPINLAKDDCEKEKLASTLASLTMDFLESFVNDNTRQGGFVRSFQVSYTDSVCMVTVGGILPTCDTTRSANNVVFDKKWKGVVDEVIQAPPMTLREVATLQAELPRDDELTRANVRELGFDLLEDQLRSFQRHNKYLPNFAEIVT